MAKLQVVRIELTNPAKSKLGKLSDQHDMTQVALMSRLVEWYAPQDELIQGAVMGHYPAEISKDIGKLIAKKLAK